MSDLRVPERHYSLEQAAEVSGMSVSALKRAIQATEGHVLRAKKAPSRTGGTRRRYLVAASALAEFLEGLDEA